MTFFEEVCYIIKQIPKLRAKGMTVREITHLLCVKTWIVVVVYGIDVLYSWIIKVYRLIVK